MTLFRIVSILATPIKPALWLYEWLTNPPPRKDDCNPCRIAQDVTGTKYCVLCGRRK